MRRLLTLLALFFLVAAPLASEARTELHRSNASEPDSLDAQKLNLVPDQTIVADLYQGLLGMSPKGEVFNSAAEGYEVSEDGLTYTFHLREGLLWSDGVPVTAADYAAGITRFYDPSLASPSAPFAYVVKNSEAVNHGTLPLSTLGLEVPDARTLVIELERPTPLFTRVVTAVWFFPIPRHVAERGEVWFRPETFVGNGPFVLTEWSPNDKIVLEKNPLFIDADQVKLEKVFYHPAEDTEASLKRFRAGELDFVAGVPGAKIDFLLKKMPDETRIGPRPANNYVVFNTASPPFDDIRVRKALSLAIDREVFVEKILRRGEEPAYHYVPTAVPDFESKDYDFRAIPMPQRKDMARALLKEAGFDEDNPLAFELRVRGSPDRKRGALALRSMWQAVGVEVEILSTDLKVHYSDLNLGKFQVADAGFVGTASPDIFLEEYISTNTQSNFASYRNPEYDEVLRAALEIADLKTRHARMAEAEQILMADYPVAPINFSVTGNLVKTYLKGYYDNPVDSHQSRYMWIEE